jgi:predicted metal-dependent hydrolase
MTGGERSASRRELPNDSPRAGRELPANGRERPATILQGGRAKAYRPLSAATRRRALREGLDAYDRGDFFLAHELLEPAWMGTADLPERELLQGLIKLAAAHVHGVRGNPAGVMKNLEGARERLVEAGTSGERLGLDSSALVAAIERRLARVAATDDPPIAIPRAEGRS